MLEEWANSRKKNCLHDDCSHWLLPGVSQSHRKCSYIAASLCVACWTRALAVPRAVGEECAGQRKGRTRRKAVAWQTIFWRVALLESSWMSSKTPTLPCNSQESALFNDVFHYGPLMWNKDLVKTHMSLWSCSITAWQLVGELILDLEAPPPNAVWTAK